MKLWITTIALAIAVAPRAGAIGAEEAAAGDPNVVVDPGLFGKMKYRMIGPFRGGRSTAVAGVRGELFTFYMGATGGGVWKTTNAGTTWANVSDGDFGVGSIGAIAVAESDPSVVYVGTGSACPRGNVSPGDGMYRSTDAGRSWGHIGLPEAGQIARIHVHPGDPDLVYVAVLGHIFGRNEERGVYRSRDGGTSWDRVLHVSDRTGAVDLAMNPKNPRELYAAMWRAERKPWTLIDGGVEGGLYKTTNGGDDWKRIEALPPLADAEEGEDGATVGRIGVAVSPANPDRVWALVTATGDAGGLYRSEDGGEKWERISGDRRLQTRGWYYTHVHADPSDENTVWVSNDNFLKSIDGGRSFRTVPTPHGDNHDLWINPDHPDVMVQANDGGANVSLDRARTWSSILNQPTAEFYRVAVDDQFPYRVYGAQQDNTTIGVPSRLPRGLTPQQHWLDVKGGESGHIAVDPRDPTITYAGNYIGRIDRFDRRADHVRNVIVYPQLADGVPPRDLRYRFQWNAPILVSRHDPDVVYHASQFVHRTRDGGMSWTTISPDLTWDDEEKQELPGGPVQHDDTGVEVYGTVFVLSESPHDPAELWAGTDDGRIHLTRDGGATWREITPKGMPADGTVNSLDLSSRQPGRAIAAVYRYRLDDFAPYIFMTEDYGESWTSLAGGENGIPADHFVRVVREDPNRDGLLYAGTEFGLYVSFDDGSHWQPLQLNLPIVPVADLAVHRDDLVVATHGRSFWVLDDLTHLHQLGAQDHPTTFRLFTPRTATLASGARPGRDQEPGVPDAYPGGALVHYVLPRGVEPDGDDELVLEIVDADGVRVRRVSSRPDEKEKEKPEERPRRRGGDGTLPAEEGMNRYVWNLRTNDLDAVEGAVMSLSGTRGGRVPPGRYTLRLSLGEETLEAPLDVVGDPRHAHVTDDDLGARWLLMTRLRDDFHRCHDAVRTIRSVRAQLEAVVTRMEAAGIEGDFEERAEAITDELEAIEEELIQTRNEAGQDPLNFPPRIDNQLAYLYAHVDSSNGRPTEGAYQRAEDLEKELQPHLDTLQAALDQHVPILNDAIEAAGASGIVLPDRATVRSRRGY